MEEIYTFSENSLSLNISSDSTPTAHLYDSQNNVLTTLSVTGSNPYIVAIPYQFTIKQQNLRVDWTFTVASQPIVQSEFLYVVTPYISLANLSTLNSTTSAYTNDQLKMLEQTVRTVINNYCAQYFGSQNKTIQIEVQQQRGYILNLPERCWNVNSIYSQYDSNTDLFSTGVWKLTDPHTLMTNFHYQMGDIFYEDYLITGPLPAPITFSDQHFFRAHSYWLTVTGDFGWQTVPADIMWAAKRLANTYSCNDDTYRVKQVQTVGSNTWTVGYNPGVYNSTGDLDVDKVLDNYYIPRIGVI